jgi:hypothetical protein
MRPQLRASAILLETERATALLPMPLTAEAFFVLNRVAIRRAQPNRPPLQACTTW